jgi:transposase-like protein
VIRLAVLLYVKYPLSLRNVEDLLFERGIDLCHETAIPNAISSTEQPLSSAAAASGTFCYSPAC